MPVGPEDDRIAQRYPELIRVHDDGWRDLKRMASDSGTMCICLRGSGAPSQPFRCTIYPDRPTNCRELEAGSENCTLARGRVGLPPLPAAEPLPGAPPLFF